jgi:hypothetical protein
MAYTTIPELSDAVIDLENELGVNPSGPYTTVRARLDILESRIGSGGGGGSDFVAGLDLDGTANADQKVIGLQGNPLPIPSGSNTSIIWNGSSLSWGNTGSSFNAGLDLSGDENNQTVIGLRGNSLPTPSGTNTVITWSGTALSWSSIPSGFTAGGDLSGTSSSQNVIKLSGATVPVGSGLTTGNILKVSGANALTYGQLDLANTNSITGLLPAGNQSPQTLAGNVTGASNANTVVSINSATVPAAGALVTGNVLRVNGASSLTYAAVNLAGGANHVTGVLPTSNQASQTVGGNLSGTTASATVTSINNSTVPAGGALVTGNVLRVNGASALTYAAVNLAGGTNHVTGLLPTANQVAQVMGGDGYGTTAALVVQRVNGATVPISGALTTGNVLQVNGISSLVYGAVNLAGGSNFVTGLLPEANQVDQTMGGDVSGSTGTAQVIGIRNNSVPNPTGTNTVLNWSGSAFSWAANQSFNAGGDLAGNASVQTVIKANGVSLESNPVANKVLVSVSGTASTYAQIVDGYVAAGANISGSKINPAFGSQNLSNTGTLATGSTTGINTIIGGNNFTVRTITGNITLDTTTTDMIVLCNFSGAATVTLPTPSLGRVIIFKDIAGTMATNNLTIAPNASESIEGVAGNKIFQTDFGSFTIVSDNTNWWLV